MEIEKQFSNCGCAVMLEEDTGRRIIQPALGCDAAHDWSLILAALEPEADLFWNLTADSLKLGGTG